MKKMHLDKWRSEGKLFGMTMKGIEVVSKKDAIAPVPPRSLKTCFSGSDEIASNGFDEKKREV